MKKLVWEKLDGTVRISHPDVTKKNLTETDDEFYLRMIEAWKIYDPTLAGLNVEVVETIPTDAEQVDRELWELKNGKVKVNAQKKADKDAEKVAKKAEKDAVLAKLGITEQEFDDLK